MRLTTAKLLFAVFQRYILRAIHNAKAQAVAAYQVVCGISKIHFESNSQHNLGCAFSDAVVCGISKIHFESNSQLARNS